MSNYSLISENEALKRRVKELEQENAMLKRVEKAFDEAPSVDHALTDDELNKIKAQAVRGAIYECEFYTLTIAGDASAICVDDLLDYANKLEE